MKKKSKRPNLDYAETLACIMIAEEEMRADFEPKIIAAARSVIDAAMKPKFGWRDTNETLDCAQKMFAIFAHAIFSAIKLKRGGNL